MSSAYDYAPKVPPKPSASQLEASEGRRDVQTPPPLQASSSPTNLQPLPLPTRGPDEQEDEKKTGDSPAARAKANLPAPPEPGVFSFSPAKGVYKALANEVEAYNALKGDTAQAYLSQQAALKEIRSLIESWFAFASKKRSDTENKQALFLEQTLGPAVAKEGYANASVVSHDPKYAMPKYADAGNAATMQNWLDDPELGPIFRYWVKEKNHNTEQLAAWDRMVAWERSPTTAADALAIYDEFEMGGNTVLNVPGGNAAIGAMRASFENLRRQIQAAQTPAPPRSDAFAAIKTEFGKTFKTGFRDFSRETDSLFGRITTPSK